MLVFYSLATKIDYVTATVSSALSTSLLSQTAQQILVSATTCIAWGLYFVWQSIGFASLWCLGHEAGHGTLSDYSWVNSVLGFILHTVRGCRVYSVWVRSDAEYFTVSFHSLLPLALNPSCPPRESFFLENRREWVSTSLNVEHLDVAVPYNLI